MNFYIEAHIVIQTAAGAVSAPIKNVEQWREAEDSPAHFLAMHNGCSSASIEEFAAQDGAIQCYALTRKRARCRCRKLTSSFDEFSQLKKSGWNCPLHRD